MARERQQIRGPRMPRRLARFDAAEWPPEDLADAEEHHGDRDPQLFAWRRHCEARREWVREHGGSLLAEIRRYAAGRHQILGTLGRPDDPIPAHPKEADHG